MLDRKMTVTLTEFEAEILWLAMNNKILEIISDKKEWSDKEWLYNRYREIQEKINIDKNKKIKFLVQES